ncbi:CrcB family protein [Salinibacterium sp. dk2585]|uniref:fluoride efflux transporter FluC n=1 Tax=unclassified Salinibacterium TaxID=2632331 RepID=UPI0011C24B9E|nr:MULTISPECIES: CrcB family protein [unclassified Salinibacterium]QEE61434.1 CrcB family protein [Salinibacterium sp. dk2585]TXK54111.1 CrcB family protein [Salinibacterium sp. dk5596]
MAPRPEHLKWAPIGLVFVGGACGAATSEWLSLVIPKLGEVPVSIAIINVIGAFLLGYLYEALTRLDNTKPTGKNLKLLLGTGYCGGFTTYSSLATDTGVLFRDGLPVEATIYSLGTVLVGACATWLGIVIANAVNKARGPETEQPADQTWKAS